MTTLRHIILSLLTVFSFGCTQLEDPLPSFIHISDPEYTPEKIDEWPAYAFIFDNDTCRNVRYYQKLRDLSEIDAAEGQTVSIVAFEENDKISFTDITSGKNAAKYIAVSETYGAIVSRSWGTMFKVQEQQNEFRQILRPITTDISMHVVDAPETFGHASLTLDGFHNGWNIYSDTYSTRGTYCPVDLTTSGEEVSASIFPAQEADIPLTLNIRTKIEDKDYQTEISMDRRSLLRASAEISIDFSQYASKGTFDIILQYRSILNPQNTYEIRKTVRTSSFPEKPDNRHYSVQSNDEGIWNDQKVYDALCSNADKHPNIWNDWANRKAMRDTMSYCLIDTEFPAKIRVRKNTSSYSKVEIRPSTYGIETKDCGDNTIEFTIPSEAQGKISVEFDGDRQHNLFIYARRPDTAKPTGNSGTVKYYGKGEHNAGTIWLTTGQTLYIDHGAKVYANIKTQGSNITIAGHGILSGEKMTHHGDNQYSWGDFLICHNTSKSYVSNLTIKDITMIDSPGWNLIIPQTDGVTIDGVNMISWELNGDGIDIVSSRNVEIKNCFIRTYDDAITLKCRFIVSPITDVSNVNIHDCLIWADYARGIVIGPEAGNSQLSTGRIHDVTVRNCTFLQHKRGLNDDLRAAFAIGQGSDGQTALWSGSNPPNTISDISASGLTFDNIDRSGRNVAIWQYSSPVYMENISFTDFKVIDNNSNIYPALTIKTNGSRINRMKVRNFTVNGTKMTGSSSLSSIDKPANVNITFE